MWPERQQTYARALLDPALAVPAGIDERLGRSAEDRFAVYRNNVVKGLADALAEAFPVVAALVGEEFFAAMAAEFVRACPPASPVLLDYGRGFADFIEAFEPAQGVPYLADVARLEHARTDAYHAADAEPVTVDALSTLDERALADAELRMHPSLRLVRSASPVVSIWQAHQDDDPETALAALPDAGECALVLRPTLAVEVHLVSEADFEFIWTLSRGVALGVALNALAETAGTEPARSLAALFAAGAVVAVA